MMKEMKFTELRHYVASWECGQKSPEVAYGILMCIGYLRREWLEKDEIAALRKVELMARKDMANFVTHYETFMQGALLHKYAKALDKELDEDSVDQFLQLRDESQMVFEILQEYVEEENYPTRVLPKVRDYHLIQVDSEVLWDKSKVKAIQGLVIYSPTPPALDTEIFWWWSKSAYEDGCWLPGYFRDRHIAASIDKVLEEPQKLSLQYHLQGCPDCQTQYEMTLAIVGERLEERKPAGIRSFQDYFNATTSMQDIPYSSAKETEKMAAAHKEKPKRWKGETPDKTTKWEWVEEKGQLVLRISSRNMRLKDYKLVVRVGKVEKQCVLQLKLDQLIARVSFSAEERKKISPNAKAELAIL